MFKWIRNSHTVQTVGFAGKVVSFIAFFIGLLFRFFRKQIFKKKVKEPVVNLDDLRLEFYESVKDLDEEEISLRIRNFWVMTQSLWGLTAMYLLFSLYNIHMIGIIFSLVVMGALYLIMGYQVFILKQCAPAPYSVFFRMIKKNYKIPLPIGNKNLWVEKIVKFKLSMEAKTGILLLNENPNGFPFINYRIDEVDMKRIGGTE